MEKYIGGGYKIVKKGKKVTLITPAIETELDGNLKAVLPKEIVEAFNEAKK